MPHTVARTVLAKVSTRCYGNHMPKLQLNNPLTSLDLTSVDLRKNLAPVAKVARDAAYVAVGVGVIAAQRVSARRYDVQQRVNKLQERVNDMVPRVRDEAQATAQRVIDEATSKVRSVVERRKNVAAASDTTVA
jgi:gas vesicle protein